MKLLSKDSSVITLCLLAAIFAADVCFSVIEASRLGCSNPLGMQDGKIKNSQLSSYSHYDNDSNWEASQARLHNDKAWCSNANDNWNEYFQIDLLRIRHVSSMDMQGYRQSIALFLFKSHYVKTFILKYSYDGVKWYNYEASDGADVTFTGNSNPTGVKNIQFRDTFVTRFLRIYPKEFYRDMCLRLELYGCSDQADDCSNYITEPSGSISSPGYPDSYPHNKDCTWLISVSRGTQIALMFTHFDVYEGSNPQSCSDDFVEVRDGLTDFSRHIGGKYCNENLTMLILTTRNVARIHFHSGSGSSSYNGFQIEYLSIKPGLDDVFAVKACSGDKVALNCSAYDHTINILHAWYQTSHSCGQNLSTKTSSCPPFDAKKTVVSQCQDYKECHITLSEPLFNNSCLSGSARPQLEVFYQCTSRDIKTRPPTPPPTPSTTKAPSTTPSATTNRPEPSHSLTGNFTVSSTLIPATDPTTTISPSQSESSVSTDIPPPTKRTTFKSAPPQLGVSEAQVGGGMTLRTLATIIVVVISVIIIALLIIVYLVYKKRRKKKKGCRLKIVEYNSAGSYSSPDEAKAVRYTPDREYCLPDNNTRTTMEYKPDREYSLPYNATGKRCPLDYSGSKKGNAYEETVNMIYVSADHASEPNDQGAEVVDAYARCPVSAPLPKVTENPLYKGIAPPFSDVKSDKARYELVKSSSEHDSPPNSPLQGVRSIENPNYENTLLLTARDSAIPDEEKC